MKTIITFHFYLPLNKQHTDLSFVFDCSEIQAREEAAVMGKEYTYFTHITSKVV